MQMHQQFHVDIVPPACNFIKKETPAQLFSSKFCKISKNIYLAECLPRTASDDLLFIKMENKRISNIITSLKGIYFFLIFLTCLKIKLSNFNNNKFKLFYTFKRLPSLEKLV